MVIGGNSASSFSGRNDAVVASGESPHRKGGTMGGGLGNARDSPAPYWDRLIPGVQHGADLTRIVVGRRMQYARSQYSTWSGGLARGSLGTKLMGTSNSVEMHDTVHFLHLAQGINYPRPHGTNGSLKNISL